MKAVDGLGAATLTPRVSFSLRLPICERSTAIRVARMYIRRFNARARAPRTVLPLYAVSRAPWLRPLTEPRMFPSKPIDRRHARVDLTLQVPVDIFIRVLVAYRCVIMHTCASARWPKARTVWPLK